MLGPGLAPPCPCTCLQGGGPSWLGQHLALFAPYPSTELPHRERTGGWVSRKPGEVSCSHQRSKSDEGLLEAGAISRHLGEGMTNEVKATDTPLMSSFSLETKLHPTADDSTLEKHFPRSQRLRTKS